MKKIFIVIVVIFVILLTLITVSTKGIKMDKYLKENVTELKVEDAMNTEDLAVLNEAIVDKDIFFTAELHGIEANQELELKFLKYFKENADIKYILEETSYSHAYFMNQYLESGDEELLKELFKPLKGTYAWTINKFDFYKKLYEYNQTLEYDKRLRYVGVDIEHQPVNAVKYLKAVIPENKEVPVEIEEIIDLLKSKTVSQLLRNGEVSFLAKMKQINEDQGQVYSNYFGKNYLGIKIVIQNMENKMIAYDAKKEGNFDKVRDKMIYENFLLVKQELEDGKFYGQWGLMHAYQTKERDVVWFGAYLNSDDSPYKNRILTIAYSYLNCSMITKEKNRTYGEKPLDYGIKEIRNFTKGDSTVWELYDLSGDKTPFDNIAMVDIKTDKKHKEPITDFIQYIVNITGSPASRPLQ